MIDTQLEPAAGDAPGPDGGSDDATRAIVARLSRRHRSGGTVIERAAILAEGADATRVVAWVIAHGGQPEVAVVSVKRGLHSARLEEAGAAGRAPLRYIMPAGALA